MRLLPEYSTVKTILLALPYAGSDWDSNLAQALSCYREMVESFLKHDGTVNVLLIVHPDVNYKLWLNDLSLSKTERTRLNVITDIEYDDTWVRDYGPLTLRERISKQPAISYKSFGFNGWGGKYLAVHDNAVPTQLVRYGVDPHIKRSLVLEGGALEINGQGVLLVNEDCVVDIKRNAGMTKEMIAIALNNELGLEDIEWIHDISLTGDDTDGHIDTLARFIADDRIVCCGRNRTHHDAENLERLNQQLEVICDRRKWELLKLPVPVVTSDVDGRLLPATYANFLMCNDCVFVPVYGQPEDGEAITTLERALPDLSIVAVRCEALLEQHGSLHCATMQIC